MHDCYTQKDLDHWWLLCYQTYDVTARSTFDLLEINCRNFIILSDLTFCHNCWVMAKNVICEVTCSYFLPLNTKIWAVHTRIQAEICAKFEEIPAKRSWDITLTGMRRTDYFLCPWRRLSPARKQTKKMYLCDVYTSVLYTIVQLLYFQEMCMQLMEPEHHKWLQLSS